MPSQQDSQLHLADVLMEISIMERFRDVRGVCQLLDYGVTPEGFKLIMPLYQGDLAAWRSKLPKDIQFVAAHEQLFLGIFRQVLLQLSSDQFSS
jgi:serine/threonine protein kinase